uniref:LysR family transcriptional regulator n=1 Tax=Anaerococcus mediterraneensis TaxID=1870984 RepID=UPI00093101F8|nr:LysR family transcriptional regulator [Anaerococcus mediterraneensis]
MKENYLRYFLELVKFKNYTRAAESLFVSQSTVSKAIKQLETDLSCQLIDMTGGNFKLTQAGEIFYKYATEVIEFLDKKEENLRKDIKSLKSNLYLGLPPTAGSMYFFDIISKFKEKYPEIDLHIVSQTSKYIPELLNEGQIDLGVVIEPFENENFRKHIVFQSESVLIVNKEDDLAKNDIVDFSILKDQKFLTISKNYMYYKVFLDKCRQAGFEPNIIFENYHWDLILEMVIDKQGISILPLPLVDKYISKRAKYIKLKNPDFFWALTLIYPKNRSLTSPMKNFIDLSIEESRKMFL